MPDNCAFIPSSLIMPGGFDPTDFELARLREYMAQGREAFTGWIYCILAERAGLVKVGYSVNVTKRVSELQVASPIVLVAVAVQRGSHDSELAFHRTWRESARHHGEWYIPTVALCKFLSEEMEPAQYYDDWLLEYGGPNKPKRRKRRF